MQCYHAWHRWGVRRFTKRDGDPAIALPYFYGSRSAILERIHKGERADLPVQTLIKVSLSSI